MILCPIGSRPAQDAAPIPAWQAVEQKQKQRAGAWWLVAQPDHAALAADLAARLTFPGIPRPGAELIQAISAHDAGWAPLDLAALNRLSASHPGPKEKPASFLEMTPADFVPAWKVSIEEAERIAVVGGLVVSEHFQRLARVRPESRQHSVEDTIRLQQFLVDESRREVALSQRADATRDQISRWTDVLQFCDLVSLYLCCGAEDAVEFPQSFDGVSITARRQDRLYVFTPAVFSQPASFGVSATRYPEAESRTLAFRLG
jgi:hypothetical protein